MKLPKNPLEQHIRNCTNLCSFMDRITKSYFNDEKIFVKPKDVIKTSTNNRESSPQADDDHAALRRIQVLSVLGAMIAMGLFAVYNGIVAVSCVFLIRILFDFFCEVFTFCAKFKILITDILSEI